MLSLGVNAVACSRTLLSAFNERPSWMSATRSVGLLQPAAATMTRSRTAPIFHTSQIVRRPAAVDVGVCVRLVQLVPEQARFLRQEHRIPQRLLNGGGLCHR